MDERIDDNATTDRALHRTACLAASPSSALAYIVMLAVFTGTVAMCTCVLCRATDDGHLHRD